MITINNNIDSEYKAKIYYKDKFIGECLNELAFLDVQVQILKECSEDYSCELIKVDNNTNTIEVSKRIKFTKTGKFKDFTYYKLYWPSFNTLLKELVGF